MSLKVATPEAARRAVAYWSGEDATWIKFLGRVTREVLRAAIEEAHARGIRVTGHLCSVTFTEAAALGIDLLQHGFITNTDYVPGKQPDVCPPDNMRIQADVDVNSPEVQATIHAIVQNRTAVASTLAAYESFVPDRPLDPRGLDLLAADTRKEVESIHADLALADFNVPPRLLQKMMAWERAFVAAGGLLGAGVDPWGTGVLRLEPEALLRAITTHQFPPFGPGGVPPGGGRRRSASFHSDGPMYISSGKRRYSSIFW